MEVEIVTIGNELLNGDLADTNTARLATFLRARGIAVAAAQTVPDVEGAIVGALRLAGERAQLVLVSGGMGPTEDDLTMEAAALVAGRPLVEDAGTLARLRARFEARGYPFTPNNARQARAPEGAAVLENPVGTAPCVRLEACEATYFFFPGVPHELARLADDYLGPWLAERAGARPYRSVKLKTFGKTESQVATMLEALPRDPRLHVAYRAHFPEIQVSFHATEPDAAAADALLAAARDGAREALGDIVFTEDPAVELAEAVGQALVRAGRTLAAAESCTGGLVGKLCTDVAGSSAWYLEGAITYSNAAKSRQLGVPEALIAAHGAVSEEVARAMAEGMRERSGADYALAITGIAGPSGGTPDKPVGTIHFALAGPEGTSHVHRRLPFDRERNRVVSAWFALDMVRRRLLG